jgi:PAS domain-containing protein
MSEAAEHVLSISSGRRRLFPVLRILLARQRAERDFAAERLRITLASIGDGVISTDAEGRVTFLNGLARLRGGERIDHFETVRVSPERLSDP